MLIQDSARTVPQAIQDTTQVTLSRLEDFPYWRDYLGVAIVALIAALVAYLVLKRRDGSSEPKIRPMLHVALPIFALGSTGLAVGILVGNSLTPLAGAALSGFLTIAGALLVFIVSKDAVPASASLASGLALAALATTMVYGASISASYRAQFVARQELREMTIERWKKQFDTEMSLYDYGERKRIDGVVARAAKQALP